MTRELKRERLYKKPERVIRVVTDESGEKITEILQENHSLLEDLPEQARENMSPQAKDRLH